MVYRSDTQKGWGFTGVYRSDNQKCLGLWMMEIAASENSACMFTPQEGSDDLPGIMPRAFEYMVAQVAANSGEAGQVEGQGLIYLFISLFGGPVEPPG